MDPKRLAIGSVVGAIVFNVYGILVWGWLFADFFAAHQGSVVGLEREEPVMWAVLLASLFSGALVTLVLEWTATSSVADGLKNGMILGFLWAAGVDFLFFGFMNMMDLTAVLADIPLAIVQWGLAGAAIAATAFRGRAGEVQATV